VDTNGDGAITDDDKVMIGDPNPDYQANFSLNFGYKGFDLSLTTVGKFGHQIANHIVHLPIHPYKTTRPKYSKDGMAKAHQTSCPD